MHFEKSATTDESAHKHSGYESDSVVVICKHAGKLSATVSINKMKFKKIQFKNTEIINKCQ